jgi:hypothetical protein
MCVGQRRQRDKITTARSEDNPCHYGQVRVRGSVLNVGVGGEWIGLSFAEREFTT